jgi:hypothetical protein
MGVDCWRCAAVGDEMDQAAAAVEDERWSCGATAPAPAVPLVLGVTT